MARGTGLRAGFAVADITPEWPVWLAGFAVRTAPSDGVAHPLHVRVALLETGGDRDDPARLLVVAADLLNWDPDLLPGLRERLSGLAAVPPERILFAASHTHSAPQTTRWQAPSLGRVDERYVRLLADRVAAAVTAAAGRLQPVTLTRGAGRHDLGTYRRAVYRGVVTDGPNPAGPRDPELTALGFWRADGGLAGSIVHYTCHPVISAEQQVSGDFTGAAMTLLDGANGGVNLYLQGCCGDINPGRLGATGLAEVDRQARILADLVGEVLAGSPAELVPGPLAARWRRRELPFDHAPTAAEIRTASESAGVLGEWGRAFTAHPERVASSATFRVQRLDLAPGCALLAMNGEVTVGYGLAIRDASDGRVLPVGYSNGMIGYLPSAEQIREGGYEPDTSTRYYLLPGRYSPRIEGLIRDTTLGMARGT